MLLLLFFLIMGIATGCIDTLSSALVASLPLENSSAALNILHAGYSLGAVVGPFATLLFDGGSTAWSTAYLVCGGIITAVALLMGIVSFWASKHCPAPSE
jgi:MFS family permease